MVVKRKKNQFYLHFDRKISTRKNETLQAN